MVFGGRIVGSGVSVGMPLCSAREGVDDFACDEEFEDAVPEDMVACAVAWERHCFV